MRRFKRAMRFLIVLAIGFVLGLLAGGYLACLPDLLGGVGCVSTLPGRAMGMVLSAAESRSGGDWGEA